MPRRNKTAKYRYSIIYPPFFFIKDKKIIKAPTETKIPWRLHIGIFRKLHFILHSTKLEVRLLGYFCRN
jgi:hypothetical protein